MAAWTKSVSGVIQDVRQHINAWRRELQVELPKESTPHQRDAVDAHVAIVQRSVESVIGPGIAPGDSISVVASGEANDNGSGFVQVRIEHGEVRSVVNGKRKKLSDPS